MSAAEGAWRYPEEEEGDRRRHSPELGEVEEGEVREGGQDGQHLSGGRKGGREGLSICLVVQVLSGNTCT